MISLELMRDETIMLTGTGIPILIRKGSEKQMRMNLDCGVSNLINRVLDTLMSPEDKSDWIRIANENLAEQGAENRLDEDLDNLTQMLAPLVSRESWGGGAKVFRERLHEYPISLREAPELLDEETIQPMALDMLMEMTSSPHSLD